MPCWSADECARTAYTKKCRGIYKHAAVLSPYIYIPMYISDSEFRAGAPKCMHLYIGAWEG